MVALSALQMAGYWVDMWGSLMAVEMVAPLVAQSAVGLVVR